MLYESKFFNLRSVPRGWNQDEFVNAIKVLESLNRPSLLELLQRFQITFNASPESIDDEAIISALLTDTPKEELITALKSLPR